MSGQSKSAHLRSDAREEWQGVALVGGDICCMLFMILNAGVWLKCAIL